MGSSFRDFPGKTFFSAFFWTVSLFSIFFLDYFPFLSSVHHTELFQDHSHIRSELLSCLFHAFCEELLVDVAPILQSPVAFPFLIGMVLSHIREGNYRYILCPDNADSISLSVQDYTIVSLFRKFFILPSVKRIG